MIRAGNNQQSFISQLNTLKFNTKIEEIHVHFILIVTNLLYHLIIC